ncbi:MAG TPA: HNH endonuclease signature motif containing protein, partial [Polyangiaceae bacterium]|nr:HNH endonuclease signature motif containing protein [Polyangiaceae bacterium]
MNGVEATAGGTSRAWVRAHADVLTVARERAGLEGREGACLLRAFREDVHRHLGYGAFPEYADRYLGYGHRTTQDKLRTAEALEHLPELARALQEGQLHASAVRELTRVATRETEGDWIAAAAGRRMREIERLVAGRARGDRPSDAARRELERHVLRFEVSGETLAAFREVMAWLREQSGQALDDDAALLMLARSVLCGAGGEMQTTAPTATETTAEPAAASHPATGRSKYQIRLMVCERWGRGCQRLGADQIEVEPAMVDAARCDATVYNDPPANTDAHVDALDQPARAQTIASPHVSAPVASARAKATIPPAVRRRVLERDRQRCQIPGCRHTLDLDVHHILPRADGGTHDPRYLITLCGAHHRAVHAGRLQLSGAAGALCVRHADGSAYGAAIAPAAASNADIGEQVFRGLRGLGFKETEAKR